MLTHKSITFMFLGLILILGACSTQGPKEGAVNFYQKYQEARLLGLPDKKQQDIFRSVISNELAQLISAARAGEDASKEEGPPLIQADIFSSNFEGLTGFEVGSCSESGKQAQCEVNLTYLDPYSKATVEWKDKLLLIQESGKWVVDDIEFGGHWPFASKVSLRKTIQGAINYYNLNKSESARRSS